MIKSPFKFLDSYSLDDRNTFFGRDQEITDLFRKVLEGKILLVYGISGTGKSSLVNCGLASRFDQSDWLPINVRRGGNIINSLNEAVNRHTITSLKKTQSFLDKIQSLYLDHFKPVFLIFDQFEELFIFGSSEEKKEFLELIKDVVRSRLNCNVIFVIREEFLAGMTEFDYDLPEIFSNRYRVEKMKKNNAISAIEGPCNVNGIRIEPGFSEELINKLSPSGTDVELTYLQIYLDRIFKIASEGRTETDGLVFSNEFLNKAGSVSDLLGQFLDEQVRQLDNPETGMSILKSFVSVQGTKRQMNESQILDTVKTFGKVISGSDLLKCLTKFVDLRILREKDESGHFELRHDALASKIYEKFTALEKDIIEVRQFIENAWHNYQKREVLLSASDLEYIAPYESRLYLTKESSGLIEKSKNQLVRAKRRRRNIAITATITLLIIFAGFTIWALKERNTAQEQRSKALAESKHSKVLLLIAKARETNISNPTKAIRYAQLAYENDSTNVLVNQTLSDLFHSTDSRSLYAVSMGHKEAIYSGIFSPDGKSILTASDDKTAKLWDLSGKCLVTFSGHSDWVISAVFSPDGKSILSASGDKTAKLWDLSGKCLATFSGHSNYVYSAVFSPDGKSILTASHDNTAKLWDLSGKCLITFSGHSDWVNSAVFSLDGKSILTASFDKTAKLWDLSGKCLITLAGHSAGVYSAVFSADGKSILTVSFDETAKLWLTPSSITKWLNTAKIGSLSPADKAEIDELDDFYNIQLSDDISFITEYANWYLNKLDTTKAVILYERALQLNPMSVDKKLLGDIYRTQNETNKYFEYYKNEPEAIIKDSISSIVDTSTTNNYYGIYLYYLVRTRLYEQLLKVEPSEENKYKAAYDFDKMGWNALYSGRNSEALKAFQRGLELNPEYKNLLLNLPLGYLFNNQEEKAMALFQEYKNKPWDPSTPLKTYKDAFLNNFHMIEIDSIPHPDFEKMKALLKK